MKKTTAERLQEIMAMRGLKQVDILKMCEPYAKRMGIKFQKSALSQYISGKYEPNQYKLTILSLALNVSETWLMGFDVPMEKKKITTDDLTDGEKALIDLFRCLPIDKQQIAVEMIRAALQVRQ
jgi:transcriptional regulator with XRE-family HTH domain